MNPTRLRSYLKKKKITLRAFGEIVGAAESTVGCWTTGARLPSLAMASRIEAATGRQIKATAWSPSPSRERAA